MTNDEDPPMKVVTTDNGSQISFTPCPMRGAMSGILASAHFEKGAIALILGETQIRALSTLLSDFIEEHYPGDPRC